MKKFNSLAIAAGVAAVAFTSATSYAANKVGMYIGYDAIENVNPQESAAAKWFVANYPEGVVVTPAEVNKIDASEFESLWIHIDRVGIGRGFENLPSEFNNSEVIEKLKKYVSDGGNLYLSKFATQLVTALERIPENYAPGIFGDGDGGAGTDVWCVNAHLGSWQLNPDNQTPDETQIYDRRSHSAYSGLESFEPWSEWGNFPHSSFPMLGTGDGTAMHREDHNCMWDLNAYSYSTEGKNTIEKFEAQFDCEVIGTWGHVQDYCVAGIVDFAPASDGCGRIVANGLAACEWAPRAGVNKYHHNLELLTANMINYLSAGSTSVSTVIDDASEKVTYFNLQGVKVQNPQKGLFIMMKGNKSTKVVL